ncbi:hypothetical protein BH695_2644 [Microcystis aeruginosa PCC 7806SL]|uniref:Uncharacterized protein n=2 Tax=Microcystis aeruginosa (strain PCC 7806) TaxID=267872 RepID=A0AB33C2R6_MICA7|nr:hypothetical protein BH695_2644 [Microcystis aeruginosa PCC 7806SL]
MLNPDEAQFTAGAIKLLKDPVFWRAIQVHPDLSMSIL